MLLSPLFFSLNKIGFTVKYNQCVPLLQVHAINSVQNCKECSLTEHGTMCVNVGVKPMQEKMYTVQEVAQQLRVSERTVRNWIEQGDLIAFSIGKRGYRIGESDLIPFIGRRKQQSKDEGPPT